MANRNFPCNKLYQFHTMPILVDCKIAIGAGGAVSSVSGPGVAGAVRLAQGIYQIQLQDNYQQLFQMRASMSAPVSGSAVPDGSFSIGTVYQITAVGDTDWHAAGLQAGLTAAVGVVFKASSIGGSGSGAAKILGASGVQSVELLDASSNMLLNSPSQPLQGGFVTIKCIGASIVMNSYTPAGTNSAPALTMNSYTPAGTNDSATPPIFTGTPAVLTGSVAAPVFSGTPATLTGSISLAAVDPAAGSSLNVIMYLSNSSVQ